MRYIILLITCTFWVTPVEAYWQQKVDHKISVQLDDKNHILRGFQEMTYTNNSPDTLRYIFLHLYPNAYKHDHTAFAKQKVEDGDTKFYFSDKYEKGFIDSLEFTIDDLPLNFSKYNNHDDIVFLELVRPLLPGKEVIIKTPFRVVIPKTFSRLGHIDQSYQITQWYPKPAVYDNEGWHMMPYLDQGEFYYEYGNYDVAITLPSRYTIASTGDWQQANSDHFEGDSIWATQSQNSKKNNLKTVRYLQTNVHDFAWFADQSFKVQRDTFELPSGKKCLAMAFYTPANEKKYATATKTLALTAQYLSREVGEYPYNQIIVVDGPLYAGGGMEYPNVAIIGSLPDEKTVNLVIIHEAGHNWFQGILGSNERKHPWLDEGVNSFFETQIAKEAKKQNIPITAGGSNDIIYMLNGHVRKDQAINLSATDFTPENYGGVVYAKAAKALAYLQDYLGENDFRNAMQQYFRTWKFKHPKPTDFRKAIEENTNQDVSWFFNQFLTNSNPIDYKIIAATNKGENVVIKLKDKQGSQYPVPVFAMLGDSVLDKNYSLNNEVYFDKFGKGVHYLIDKDLVLPEMNSLNNSYKPNALFKRAKPKLGLVSSFLKPVQNKIFIMPDVAFNNYDRTMAGLIIHNISIPNKQFQFAFNPLQSVQSEKINGTAVVGYTFYPNKRKYRIIASIQGSKFTIDSTMRNIEKAIYPTWYKINPRLRIDFAKESLRNPVERALVFDVFYTAQQGFDFRFDAIDSLFRPSIRPYRNQQLFRVNYHYQNSRTFNPYDYFIQFETTKNIAKLSASGNIQIDYFMPKKALYVRAFAGKFFYVNNNVSYFDAAPYFFNVTPTAYNDYAFENTYLGRNEQTGYKSQQVLDREGGFATRTSFLANPLGQTDDWLAAINIRSDIPIKFALLPQLFLNAATFADAGLKNTSGAKALYEAGLQFNLIKNLIKINIPILVSKDFKDYNRSVYAKNERWYRQISFSLSTNRIDFLRTQEALTKLVF